MNPSSKLSICLYSDANFLAVNILENLLSKNCNIDVVTNQSEEWTSLTSHISTKNLFTISDRKTWRGDIRYDYAIFCGGFISRDGVYEEYKKFISYANIVQAKTLVLFPIEIYERNVVDSFKVSGNTAIIFIGDILGPRIGVEDDLLISRALLEIIRKRKITLAVGEVFYPIFVADAVKTLTKWLFSFGPYGKIVLLLGNQISSDIFWNVNQKLVGQLELNYDPKLPTRVIPRGIETTTINSDLNFSLTETYTWLKNTKPVVSKTVTKKVSVAPIKVKVPKINVKKTRKIVLPFLILLILPFLCLLISAMGTFGAYKSFLSGNDTTAQDLLLLSRTFAVVSEKESGFLSYVPGVGLLYKETKYAALLTEDINSVGSDSMPIIRNGTILFEKMLGTDPYNSQELSLKLESGIDLVYNDVVSIKNLTVDSSNDGTVLASKLLSRLDFDRYVNLLSQGKILVGNIPQILGQDKSKTYLVLFENNMELRPTGGFIGSFGLITFDGGRLTDLTVNDVYSADGQLNGHVEPPAPIKDYLGEANWWLRDSNWDPDFPTSAKRAEWFLDKEISKQVDGVVATDLFPIKEMLGSTGAVSLPDYNLTITSSNLYEETQTEVQNGFFPGTHQKASFLTALSRSLLTEITKLSPNQKISILKDFYESLDGRHLQLYMHDSISQDAISNLQWDGSVTAPTCGDNCYADLAGVVEANVGDNKANYFIKRNINLDLTVSPSEVDRKLTLNLTDTANPALGPSGKYKNYVRIIIPADASAISIRSIGGNTQQDLTPETSNVRDYKEVGVLVELLGGESKSIEFTWVSKLPPDSMLSSYGLYFRKQAGTDFDPIEINLTGNGVKIEADPRFSLTNTGSYSYNTTLVRDLFSRFSW